MPSPLSAIDDWARPLAAAVLAGGEIVDDRGDVQEAVPWASVTKLATALAVLVAEEWLHAAVLDPLGMTATSLCGSAASGHAGPLADLVGLVEELQRPSLLSGNMAAAMRAVAFPHLPGVLPGFGFHRDNAWGLGPEVRDGKAPHWTGRANAPSTFGHFGQAGTFVWVDPVAGVACAVLTATEFGAWAKEAWPALSDAVVEAYR